MTQHVGTDWRWLIKVCWISWGHTQVGSSLATWRQHRDRYNSDLYGTLQCCLFTPARGCDVWVATNPWKQDKLALSQSTLICSDDQGGSHMPLSVLRSQMAPQPVSNVSELITEEGSPVGFLWEWSPCPSRQKQYPSPVLFWMKIKDAELYGNHQRNHY